MYKNVGGKIKKLANLLCIIGIAASGMFGLSISSVIATGTGFFYFIWLFLLIFGLGSLISWLSSLCLYGFGELIESNAEARDYIISLHHIKANGLADFYVADDTDNTDDTITQHQETKSEHLFCSNCGKENNAHANFCVHCGQAFQR